MSDTPDQEFWDIADSFIHLANEHVGKASSGKVSSALLYAAARFNAFIVASADDADLENEKELAVDYFSGEYKKMLSENLDDYIKSPV